MTANVDAEDLSHLTLLIERTSNIWVKMSYGPLPWTVSLLTLHEPLVVGSLNSCVLLHRY